ncbi:MAG: hypothetical protein O7D86_00570 [Proteobacteria bacterium]|nr:hypothetical protein [Pseudomonadota bacterium]
MAAPTKKINLSGLARKLVLDEEKAQSAMKRLIIEGANAVQLADQAAEEGIWDIRRSGLQKAAAGVTSLVEVNRLTVD